MTRVLVLTAYPAEDASCRYRIHQFLPYLKAAGYECTVSNFASERLFRALRSRGQFAFKAFESLGCAVRRLQTLAGLSHYDLVVIHREAFPFFQPVIENWILRRHDHVIFSFDDAIYAGHSELSALSHPSLYRWKHGHGIDEVIRRSQHVIAGNHILATYAQVLNPHVTIIPTVVDCERYKFRPTRGNSAQPITIGWMGSRSTAPYLELVIPALRRISETHGTGVQFKFFGYPADELNLPNSQSLPFRVESELEDLQSLDIGLMPMPDSEWTRGKCAFKAIQYMATGAVTVASPVGITTDLIQHDANGMLAASPEEWYDALNRLIHHVELRQRLALAARKTIERCYSLEMWAPQLVATFDQVCGATESLQPETSAA